MSPRALPILPTLRGYKSSWLAADALAGLTLVAIAIPEQMATAHLAGMPEVAGFYAFVAGSLLFALFGRHARMSVGADSTIAPVFAAGVATLAVTGSPTYAHLVSATALLVGALLVVAGLLRLGWIADFFPVPVVTGVLAGIGVEIFVKQFPTVLGLPGGGTTTIGRVRTFFDQLGQFNGWSLVIAVGVLAIIVVFDMVDRRIPGALIGIVGATALVSAAGLGEPRREDRRTRPCHPARGWRSPTPAFTSWDSSWGRPLPWRSCASCRPRPRLARRPAAGGPSEETKAKDFSVDLAAVGAGSLLAGLAGSFAVDASPPADGRRRFGRRQVPGGQPGGRRPPSSSSWPLRPAY